MATVEFEERADQLTLETIDATLSDGQIFRSARKKLLATGAKLLVGPRGTGKTHLMRYTYIQAMRDKALPLALYANFSRYLNLEPLLRKSPDAIQRFHSWVIAGSPPLSRTLTRRPIQAMRSVHVEAKEVQR